MYVDAKFLTQEPSSHTDTISSPALLSRLFLDQGLYQMKYRAKNYFSLLDS
jgi:hypothetical protein